MELSASDPDLDLCHAHGELVGVRADPRLVWDPLNPTAMALRPSPLRMKPHRMRLRRKHGLRVCPRVESESRPTSADLRFVIRTRTVLTHTDMNGKDASRMHCTTECDWESSSWLKSTITPAVIKGQREHHKQLAKKISGWIQAHGGEQSVAVEAVPVSGGSGKVSATSHPESATVQESNPLSHLEDLWGHASQITGNPVMIGIIAVLLAIILLK